MLVRITLLAVCLALALPAQAAYAQDDCEEQDCDSGDEAVASEDADPDDSDGEVAEEVSADDAESGDTEGFAESGEPEEPEASDADADPGESGAEPKPATPASPPADAAALQAFRDQVGNCFLAQPIQGPPAHDPAQRDDLERGLSCSKSERDERYGQVLPVSQHTALFSLLGFRFGGDGRQNFALPALPRGYCICLRGRYPLRDGPDQLTPILKELCRLEATVQSYSSCTDLLPRE